LSRGATAAPGRPEGRGAWGAPGAPHGVGLVLLALALASAPAAPAGALERVRAVVHVHSDVSTGDRPLEELAATAERQGIDALLLADYFLARAEYGLPPFRALTRVVQTERSVLDAGPARYLARVREAQAKNPRVLLVPGVEVAPHYHWTGSPLALELGLRDSQKNLLVFGLTDPDTLAALPAVHNRRPGVYDGQSVLDALPVLLVIPGLVLLARPRRGLKRVGRAVVVVRRRRWLAGGALVALGVTALVRGWPFSADPYPPYADLGLVPHQELIAWVERQGGVTVWSLPEARDEGERWVGPVRVTWRTEPYGDDLLRTARWTAFGAIYEDTTRFERPGERWDRLLGEYAAGERSRPAWALGEAGFHGFSAGQRLGSIQTVFLVAERSPRGLLDALARGRMYALQRVPAAGLALGEFSVRAGAAAATFGETLRVAAGTALEVGVTLGADGAGPGEIRATLVRSGAVVGAWAGPPPLRVVHREVFDGRPAYFRLDARGPAPHRLLTNPVFVRPP